MKLALIIAVCLSVGAMIGFLTFGCLVANRRGHDEPVRGYEANRDGKERQCLINPVK